MPTGLRRHGHPPGVRSAVAWPLAAVPVGSAADLLDGRGRLGWQSFLVCQLLSVPKDGWANRWSRTSLMVCCPLGSTMFTRTYEAAPALRASWRWLRLPHPPEAMTGKP